MKALVAFLGALGLSAAHTLSQRDILDISSSQSRLDLSSDAAVLHLLRTDKLVDTDSQSLLAERLTHAAVKVSLAAPGHLRVGDQLIPLLNAESSPVQIVKTDALVLPEVEGNAQLSEASARTLASLMSPGIVSLEVRVESEVIESSESIDTTAEPSKQIDWQLRRIGVFVKVVEIEGMSMAHSRVIYAPLLQLIVKTDAGDNVVALQHITDEGSVPVMPGHVDTQTLPPFEEAAKMLPDDFRPVPTADEMPEDDQPASHYDESFFGWLAGFFGLEDAPRRHHRRPCPKKFRQGLALAEDRLAAEPVEGEVSMQRIPGDRISEMADTDGQEGHHRHHHHHGKHHGHRRRRGRCFWRRTKRAFRKLYETITSSAWNMFSFNLLVFGLSFSITRRILRCRDARRARRQQLAAFNDDEEVEKKQLDLLVDELPSYEAAVPVVIVVEEEKQPADSQ